MLPGGGRPVRVFSQHPLTVFRAKLAVRRLIEKALPSCQDFSCMKGKGVYILAG
jgi:hypothetical protein